MEGQDGRNDGAGKQNKRCVDDRRHGTMGVMMGGEMMN